jgi:hypothetical protein
MEVVKSIKLFGKELFRVERNRLGEFSYTYLDGSSFNDNGKYLELYLNNPVLSTIVNLRADIYAQMKVEHLDKNDKVIENSIYTNLIYNPNYFQSKEDFFYQQMVFLSTAGNDYIYQQKAFSNELPKAIYNLIPSDIDFCKVNKVNKFIVTEKDKKAFGEQIIKYTLDNMEYKLKLSEIIPLYDLANGLTSNSFIQSPSRVKGIAKTLNNIEQNLASKSMNLQMSQKYIGLNKNDGNLAQIKDDDRKDITRKIADKSLILTNGGIDIKHLVSDMKKLYLDEQYADDFNKCLLAFGMNRQMLDAFHSNSGLGSSGDIITQSLRMYIQNSIQSTADNTMNSLSSQWGLLDKGERLKASYNHLPVMQSMTVDKINNFKVLQETLKIAIENGTMTAQEAKVLSDEFKINLGL